MLACVHSIIWLMSRVARWLLLWMRSTLRREAEGSASPRPRSSAETEIAESGVRMSWEMIPTSRSANSSRSRSWICRSRRSVIVLQGEAEPLGELEGPELEPAAAQRR